MAHPKVTTKEIVQMIAVVGFTLLLCVALFGILWVNQQTAVECVEQGGTPELEFGLDPTRNVCSE